MIKICSTSICKPLRLIFNHCIDNGIYPCQWKKANVVPIYKKGDKQTLKNYRPVSLLAICRKSFERPLYNKMFRFFPDEDSISANFKPVRGVRGEVRGVSLDISKACYQVWHDGLILKLHENGVTGNLLKVLKEFFD